MTAPSHDLLNIFLLTHFYFVFVFVVFAFTIPMKEKKVCRKGNMVQID